MNNIHGITCTGLPSPEGGTLVRLGWIRCLPVGIHAGLGALLVSAIAALDWVTGPEISMSLLYVFAVMAVTWCGTRRAGFLVALLSAAESMATRVVGPAAANASLPASMWNAATRLAVLLAVAWLLGRLRASIREQRLRAATDPLTGVLNRSAFEVAAERERLRAERLGEPLSVAYFDLDHFKLVNDHYGHRAGDRMLREFAASVVGSIRGTDLFARVGGDEFVLLLPGTDGRESAGVVQRIREVLAGSSIAELVTVSIGIATFRATPDTVDEMIDGADSLMYRAKGRGGDRIVGAVVAGPWLAWSPPAEGTAATVDVEILAADRTA